MVVVLWPVYEMVRTSFLKISVSGFVRAGRAWTSTASCSTSRTSAPSSPPPWCGPSAWSR
ncbi:hypothetical protein ACFQV4_28755 [Streptomyces thermocarboxydus]